MRLFFFGSLIDPKLLTLVIGRDSTALERRAGRLLGFGTNRSVTDNYPILVADPNNSVAGVIVDGLNERDVARIRYFEDDEYELQTLTIESDAGPLDCQVCVGVSEADNSGEPWVPGSMTGDAYALFLLMAEEHMAHFGRTSVEEVAEMWEEFRAAAEARLANHKRKTA